MSKYQQHSGVNTNFEQTQGMGPLVKKKSLVRAGFCWALQEAACSVHSWRGSVRKENSCSAALPQTQPCSPAWWCGERLCRARGGTVHSVLVWE